MPRVYVGIGSNLRPEENVRLAIRALTERHGPLLLSPVYRNSAVGFDGDDFLNMVAGFDTAMTQQALNDDFERIHQLAGRVRHGTRPASRTLDLDLLLYGETISAQPPLPRADILDYRFVLQPLADIAPSLRHPVTGRTIVAHLGELDPATHPMQPVELDFGT